MATPPPRKRVSQACRPCGVKKIKVRDSAAAALAELTSFCSAMGHTRHAVLVKVKQSSAPTARRSEGELPYSSESGDGCKRREAAAWFTGYV
jgi:hypothetical protein